MNRICKELSYHKKNTSKVVKKDKQVYDINDRASLKLVNNWVSDEMTK